MSDDLIKRLWRQHEFSNANQFGSLKPGDTIYGAAAVTLVEQGARIARLEEALKAISKPCYGLQGIIEDHSDTNAYNYHAMIYFKDKYFAAQSIARHTLLKEAPQKSEDRE